MVPSVFYDQPAPHAGVLEWLHSLIDGEVDVDRADYLLRDARALGFEFAIYDLERLISNLTLVSDPDLGLTTAVEERGFSALESFYVSRSRSNQYLPRHHKVAQIAVAFRYLAENFLDSDQCKEFRKTLSRLGKDGKYSKHEANRLLERFGEFDDPWWHRVMRSERPGKAGLYRACADLVLDRKSAFVSIWKRKGDLSRDQVLSLNNFLSEKLAALGPLRETLRRSGILILVHRFQPVRLRPSGNNAGESLMLIRTGKNTLIPITKHSILIQSLIKAWKKDIHMHVFALTDKPISTDKVVQLILGA